MKSILLTTIAAIAAFGLFTGSAEAGERRFAFTYEATTAPKGSIELENWVTWKATRGSEKVDQFDFRHELEFGLTDHLQLGVYLSDWTIEHTAGKTKADWESAGLELIWNLSDPTTDFLGSALYGEARLGDEVFALEGKLLLQKNFGPWVIAYNAVVEAEWEGENYDEKVGAFEQNLGVSYQFSPHFTLGAELFHAVEFEDWGSAGDHAVYAGPNASVRYGRWFATSTVLFQTTDIDEEPDVQTRLIFGIQF